MGRRLTVTFHDMAVGQADPVGQQATAIRPAGTAHPGPTTWTQCRPEAFPSASHKLQDVPPKPTSLVSTVPAVRPGAVW
jgi:hypothetical protein